MGDDDAVSGVENIIGLHPEFGGQRGDPEIDQDDAFLDFAQRGEGWPGRQVPPVVFRTAIQPDAAPGGFRGHRGK
ncbi:hypothetical protein SDC9_99810 [bioreactor metagenome]|uniref:Uncharacterized protein n=1 Tax=bioreactor metagenome TaxID=1076179 RepID=A0A645AJD4_9ZZZZ